MVQPKRLGKSLKYASHGIKMALKENSFRFQILVAIAVLILASILPISTLELVALILIIIFVLVLEVLNTIIEHLTDMVKPRLHHYVGIIKDLMAAAVLIASIGAAAIGIIIFLPHLF